MTFYWRNWHFIEQIDIILLNKLTFYWTNWHYFIEQIDIFFFFWDKAAKCSSNVILLVERETTEQRRCYWWRLERYKTTAWCWRRWNLKLGCLVVYFKQQFSVFQQHYMYFYTFSHTYFQKIQITLLEQHYQTSLMIRNPIFMKA